MREINSNIAKTNQSNENKGENAGSPSFVEVTNEQDFFQYLLDKDDNKNNGGSTYSRRRSMKKAS